MNTNKFVELTQQQRIREIIEYKEALFGTINYERVVRREKVGEELIINCDKLPDRVVINDTEYSPVLTPEK